MIDSESKGAGIMDCSSGTAWNARSCNDRGNPFSLKVSCFKRSTSFAIGSSHFRGMNLGGFMQVIVLRKDSLPQGCRQKASTSWTILTYFRVGRGVCWWAIRTPSTIIIRARRSFFFPGIVVSVSSLWRRSAMVVNLFLPISLIQSGSLWALLWSSSSVL